MDLEFNVDLDRQQMMSLSLASRNSPQSIIRLSGLGTEWPSSEPICKEFSIVGLDLKMLISE